MELPRLRYFLIAAQEGNLTRAARRLNIAQPALTRQIKCLEADLSVQLFVRSRQGVELTDAGKSFACSAARILGDLREAVMLAKRAARGHVGQIRLGLTESASFNPRVMTVLRKFRLACPEVELTLEQGPATDLAVGLRERSIDVAFLRPPLQTSDAIELQVIHEEEMVVALSTQHVLARQESLDLAQLARETFILAHHAERPGSSDHVVAACERAGFIPSVKQTSPQLSSTINLVAAALGISIVPQSVQCLHPQAVAYRPIRGAPLRAQLGIAYRLHDPSLLSRRLVSLATSPN